MTHPVNFLSTVEEIIIRVQLLFSMLFSPSRSLLWTEFCPPGTFLLPQWRAPGSSSLVPSLSSVTHVVVYAPLPETLNFHIVPFQASVLLPALSSPLTWELDDRDSEQWPWNQLNTISSLASLHLTGHSTVGNLNNIHVLKKRGAGNQVLC